TPGAGFARASLSRGEAREGGGAPLTRISHGIDIHGQPHRADATTPAKRLQDAGEEVRELGAAQQDDLKAAARQCRGTEHGEPDGGAPLHEVTDTGGRAG